MASGLLNLRKQGLKVIEQYPSIHAVQNPTGGDHLMTARSRRSLRTSCPFGVAAVCTRRARRGGGRARAGEEDDLQREIDTQRVSVADLERLDELKATGDEIAR